MTVFMDCLNVFFETSKSEENVPNLLRAYGSPLGGREREGKRTHREICELPVASDHIGLFINQHVRYLPRKA